MPEADTSPSSVAILPGEMRTAQEAIHRPEIQAMLRELSQHGLGIFMPHAHEAETGSFQPLPEGVTQVEDDLKISFRRQAELIAEGDRSYLPVGWVWRDGETPGMEPAMGCALEGTLHKSGNDTSPEATINQR